MRTVLRRAAGDRGQVTIEFTGMVPMILVLLAFLWQLVLVGYTFTLAGNAADEAARAATAAPEWKRPQACRDAATRNLPKAWSEAAAVDCPLPWGDVQTAEVRLKVPVLFPGVLTFPFTVDGKAGAAVEG